MFGGAHLQERYFGAQKGGGGGGEKVGGGLGGHNSLDQEGKGEDKKRTEEKIRLKRGKGETEKGNAFLVGN